MSLLLKGDLLQTEYTNEKRAAMTQQRIAVIGTGTMGSQVLWQLSKLDCEVVGYELFSPGHSRGAASGENRIFTFVELEDLRFQPMAYRTDQLWLQLEDESGQRLRDLQGVVAFGQEGAEWTHTAVESAKALGDHADILNPEEARRKFPKFLIRDDELAIIDHGGGLIYPDRAISTAASLAVSNGARLHTSARVSSISQHDDEVHVTLADDQTEVFDRVVVAAGAWTGTLLPSIAPYFAMRRLLSTWFRPRLGESMQGLMPYVRAEPNYSYGLPTPDGTAMKLGLGFPHHQTIDSPDTAASAVTEDELSVLRKLAHDLIPALDDYPMRFGLCHESYTKKRIEWIQPHPEMDQVLVMAGFSGKGFKNSPALGEVGAQWALGNEMPEYARFLLEVEHVAF